MKNGLGTLQKAKNIDYKSYIDGCNKDTYARFIEIEVVERARKEIDRARVQVKHIRDKFMSEPSLKDVIKKYNKPNNQQ